MPQGVFLTTHTFSLSLAIRHLVVSPMPFSLGERRAALHAQARCIGHPLAMSPIERRHHVFQPNAHVSVVRERILHIEIGQA